MRAGYRFPRRFKVLVPDTDVAWDDSVTHLRETIGRLQHETMKASSPIFGPLTPDDWEKLHCRHAEMHFSFMHRKKQKDIHE